MSEKEISSAVIKRLPRYYRYLRELLESDVIRISSKELSERMNCTASQIRQDLNNFGGFGQQGYGYNVEYLYTEIAKILGLDRAYHIIIIGAGHLGQAIANYADFERKGFYINAIFDSAEDVIGKKIARLTVLSVNQLQEYVQNNPVDIAALTLPKQYAQQVATELVQLGIRAIWNFAPIDLQVPPEVTVEHVHLSDHLMQLSYNLKAAKEICHHENFGKS